MPIVETPPFKLFTHNWTDFLAGDTTRTLKLRKVAQAMRDNQQVFTHLSEPILDTLSDQLGTSDLYSWQTLMIVINLALTVISLAIIGYLLVKINMMQAALTVLALVKPDDSNDPFYIIPLKSAIPPTLDRRQAIIWTNAGILLVGPLRTNFSEILIEIHAFSLKKSILKCRGENGGHFVSASMC